MPTYYLKILEKSTFLPGQFTDYVPINFLEDINYQFFKSIIIILIFSN